MDIFENDAITVTGKKQAAEHIIARYGDFGWSLTASKDDKLYADTTHMTFTRPHFIENKDELQLLQVRLEIAYNNTGKFAEKRKTRALITGNLFALIAAAFAAGGVLLFLFVSGLVPIICGSVLCVFAVIIGVAGGIFGYRIYKKDKVKYSLLIESELQKIESLCNRAKELRGANG